MSSAARSDGQIALLGAWGEMQKVVERQGFQRGGRIFVMSAAGNGRSRSRGSGSAPSQRACCATGMIAGMRSWTVATSSLAGTVMIQNVRSHCAILITPVLPQAGDTERCAVGHGEGVQLLALVALVERIHRHDAAALHIGVGEHALVGDGLGAGVDRRDLGPRLHPMGMRPQRSIADMISWLCG